VPDGRGTVLTVHRRRCERCGRTVYVPEQSKVIEAARTADGREPVEEFFAKLEKSGKKGKHKDVSRLADVVDVLEDYARDRELDEPRELNFLEGDLWELKAGDVRISFYEVTDDLHDKPVFRLVEGFLKTQLTTQRKHINWGLRLIREDRAA